MRRQFELFVMMVCCLLPLAADADVTQRVDLDLVEAWIRYDTENARDTKESIAVYETEAEKNLSDYARRCNNTRVRLYSCKEDRLFEASLYLQMVKKLYSELDVLAQPNSAMIDAARRDRLRYQLLLQTLRCMPPALTDDTLAIELISDSIMLAESDTLLHQLIAQNRQENAFFLLTKEEQVQRDSCILLAQQYMDLLSQVEQMLVEESRNYAQLRDEFKSTSDFADERYEIIQQYIFGGGQYNLSFVVQNLGYVVSEMRKSCRDKYSHLDAIFTMHELWVVIFQMFGMLTLAILIIYFSIRLTRANEQRFKYIKKNPGIYANILYMLLLTVCLVVDIRIFHYPLITLNGIVFFVYFAYITMLQVSLLLRENGERASAAMHLYAPSITLGYVLTFLRFFFVPDEVLVMVIGPVALICFIWQMAVVGAYWNKVSNIDSSIAAATTLVMLAMVISSALGYTFLSMQIFFWWQAQQAAIAGVVALYFLLKYYMPHLDNRKKRYLEKLTGKEVEVVPTYLIQITWFGDLMRIVVVPLLGILTLPLCVYVALDYFHGGAQFIEFFHRTLFSINSGEDIVFDLSLYNVTMIASLYFVFRYVRHVATAIFTQLRIRAERKRLGRHEIEENQLNLELGHKVIAILVWGCYIIAICVILRLPLQSVTVILAGMAAGLSFAMQEILNNFFYGMQLMAGHLRVGDYVICGDYRGYVKNINYQTTQIFTETGADVSFTNKDLFSNNFQNLTKQNPYEVNRVYFDVAYGSDIQKVERLALEVVEELKQKDKYGRPLISAREVRVEMSDLAASGITMAVRFGVLAEKMTWFMPVLRKSIYDRLTEEGIEIPFNQMDLHIITDNTKK